MQIYMDLLASFDYYQLLSWDICNALVEDFKMF